MSKLRPSSRLVALVTCATFLFLGAYLDGPAFADDISYGLFPASSSPALFNRTTFDYSTSLTTTQEADRYQTMVLQSTDGDEVEQLHAANPQLKILMYADPLHASSSDPAGWSDCTEYASDKTNTSWFVKNQSGAAVMSGENYVMDVGNTAYQQACYAHTVALAKRYGFDGVLFGGVYANPSWAVPSGTTLQTYTTPRWDAAMQTFLNGAGTALHSAGLLAFANLIGTSTSQWESWTAPLDGSEEGAWTDAGSGNAKQLWDWSPQLASVAWSEAHKKYALLQSANTTQTGNTYGLTSMLLVANGYSSYATNNTGAAEAWYPTYADALQLGKPTGTYSQLTNGVYERRFQGGMVLVNPSTKSVSSFPLGGTYTSYGMSWVTSVSMAPTSGLIMLNGPSGSLFNRTTFTYGSSLSTTSEAYRYQVMVLQATDANEARALKAANPGLKILMYSMALSSRPTDVAGYSTCTTYATDPAAWFLLNQNGQRIVNSQGDYLMDWANPSYQQACLSHAMSLAKADGFDGVMFDGLNSEWSWLVPSGTVVSKYPTTAAWDAAQQSFLNYAGATLHSQGMLAMANLGGTSAGLWQQWNASLDGAAEQSWTDAGLGIASNMYCWALHLANASWSEAHRKYDLLNSWNQTEAGNVFGLASMMLVADGRTSYAANNNDFSSYERWYPEYTTAQQIGAPTGAYAQLASGIYERAFENGLVVVNPTQSSVTLSLGGSYFGVGISPTTSLTLGGLSAAILIRTPE